MATQRERILCTWSGGKDSALSLQRLQQDGRYHVVALLTTVTEGYDRVSLHGVRRTLLQHQADALGLALCEVVIPKAASMEAYEAGMGRTLTHYAAQGVCAVAFGDIFLADIRAYREQKLSPVGMGAVFPLWGQDTGELARSFLAQGFQAVITCVDAHALDETFAGRLYDEQFLGDLPAGVDPCGEKGEFHSFVYNGPLFRRPIRYQKGRVVLRDERFWFCDLTPVP